MPAAAQSLTARRRTRASPFGLRTVDGSFNNLIPDQDDFGASDSNFPLLLDPVFRNDQDGDRARSGWPAGPGAC